jgi:hypothetical protein
VRTSVSKAISSLGAAVVEAEIGRLRTQMQILSSLTQ